MHPGNAWGCTDRTCGLLGRGGAHPEPQLDSPAHPAHRAAVRGDRGGDHHRTGVARNGNRRPLAVRRHHAHLAATGYGPVAACSVDDPSASADLVRPPSGEGATGAEQRVATASRRWAFSSSRGITWHRHRAAPWRPQWMTSVLAEANVRSCVRRWPPPPGLAMTGQKMMLWGSEPVSRCFFAFR